MTSYTISDTELDGIKDQVVLITGASSGIGLATLRRILKHGGKVFAGDLNPLPTDLSNIPFVKVNVTSWTDQLALFKAAEKEYGHIDHVFCNAGIRPTVTLLEDDVDENGNLQPPNLATYDVNLVGCTYTTKLGIHYLRKNPKGGSLVLTASGSSFSRFPGTDYTVSKHGVLGLLRALHPQLSALPTPLRINAIAPSWTDTGILNAQVLEALGEGNYQSADVVGRSVTYLMAGKRDGELCYSERGNFMDLENGEKGYHALTKRMMGVDGDEDIVEVALMKKLAAMAAQAAQAAKGQAA
ncbi:hypothetical protein NX059_002995 [Plenodomus lindquistii]|nr:hypothetical protein NX059_002995 [Plenodomus lindquistii]